MKRLLVSFLLIFVFISNALVAYASPPYSEQIDLLSKTAIYEADGICMSIEACKLAYSGDVKSRKPMQSVESTVARLSIQELSLIGCKISINAKINVSGQVSDFIATGELFDSYKREKGYNNFVGVFNEQSDPFKVLLFEICNDQSKEKSSLLIKSEELQNPLFRLYLKDEKDNIYLFEMKLPKEVEGLSAPRGKYAESKNDYLWFSSFVMPQFGELPATDNNSAIAQARGDDGSSQVSPMANGSFTTYTFGNTRTVTYVFGSETYTSYSLPYAVYKHLNVRPESTWILNFKVAEHTTVNGITIRNAQNPFSYRDVDLRVAAGGSTTFISTIRQGRLLDPNGGIKQAGSQIGAYIMQKIVAAIPYGPTVQTVLGWISTANTATQITLGSNAVTLSGGKTVAVGMKTQSGWEISKCTDYDGGTDLGHYLYYQVRAQYEGDGRSDATTGYFRVKFNTYYSGDMSSTPTSKDFSLTYTAALN